MNLQPSRALGWTTGGRPTRAGSMRAMNMGMLEAHQAWAPKGGLGGGKGRLVCLAVTACNTGSYSSGCELFKGAQERDCRCAWLRAAGCGSLACVLSTDCKRGGLGRGEGRLVR